MRRVLASDVHPVYSSPAAMTGGDSTPYQRLQDLIGVFMLVQMKVHGLVFDPYQNAYIVIMRDEEKNNPLPIWIGQAEANAIGLAVEGIFPPRPLTHDLIGNVMDQLGTKIISVVLTELKDSTYYSKIHLAFNNDTELTLDARPSDAIALALRTNAPIFAHDRLIEKSEEMHKWLEGLKPEDFGEYEA